MPPAAAAATPEAGAPPRVSVVTPARDAEATLPATLASLRAQTLADFEAIVVDDGSTDGTRALAEAAAREDARFRLVALPENRGVSGARNAGLAEARGRWVLFLDADDWIEPDHLATLVAAAEADPGTSGAVTGYRYAREDGSGLGRPVRPRLDQDLFLITAHRCPFAIHACLVRREDAAEAGGFDTSLQVGEDWDLWQRLARAGRRFVPLAEAAGAVYRLRAGSATRASSRHMENCLAVIARAHAPDPRVARPLPEHAAGRPSSELARNQTPFLLAHLGNRLGLGVDATEVVARLDPAEIARLSPDEMAAQIGSDFLEGAACLPEDVPALWPGREPLVARAFDALGERAGEPGLGDALRLALARRFVHRIGPEGLPLTLGGLHAVRLGAGSRPRDVPVPPGTRVLRVYVGGGGARQALELPVPEGAEAVPRALVARAVVAARGREAARRLLKTGWRRRPTLQGLARLAAQPRGRRFLRHLATLPGGERRPALEAFLTAALPALLPAYKDARRPKVTPKERPAPPAAQAAAEAAPDETGRWEQVFAAADPWRYGSGYEQTKYGHTLELLPERGIGRALELACAEGHFTVRLAPRVGELLATDISPTALSRAAERCAEAGAANVRFARLDLAREPMPVGPFGLIVCSEVLYYLKDRRELARVARKIAGALEPGGLVVTAHANLVVDDRHSTGFDWPHGFGAATILAAFAEVPDLDHVRELRTSLYRVGLFRKREAPRPGRPAAPEILEREPSWPTDPAVAGRINRGGADLTLRDAQGTLVTRALPILMYHRVAADGPGPLATWRVHPERFEAQLDWLKRNGFRSVGLDAWLRSVERGFGELPGRAVCITFDDGYEDFAGTAWPLLQRYGFGATVFLVSDLVGRAAEWDAAAGPPAPLMDWPTLDRLRQEGVALGAHTATHPRLTRVGPGRVVDELRRSKAVLEDRLGAAMATLAYPYGFVDSLARNAADAAGYAVAVTTRHERARYGDDLLLLPRLKVAGEDDLPAFARMLDLRERAPALRRLRHARARRRGASG